MKNDTISWCGYDWTCKMNGGRIINPSFPHAWYSDSPEVLKINENGEMSLSYRYNTKENVYWDGKVYNPIIERALIRTKQHFDYGTFSIEAMMPKGLNVSCAFWMSGFGNWPPEIDIVESWSEDNNYSRKTTNHFPWLTKSWKTTNSVHYNDRNLLHCHLGSKNIMQCIQPLEPSENWIKYEVVWLADAITFKANGKTTKTIGKKYANMLTNNLKKAENGYLMDVIISINVDDPKKCPNRLDTPFRVRNFKYNPLECKN